MSLTGKGKRALRAKGNRLKESVIIGKCGISDNVVEEIMLQLKKNELIKIRLSKALSEERKKIAGELAEKCKAELIQVFGNTILMFKEKEVE